MKYRMVVVAACAAMSLGAAEINGVGQAVAALYKGKTAVITGAASGMGLCTSKTLAHAGANVVMPNLSPPDVRGKYALYDRKLHTGREAAEAVEDLKRSLRKIGCRIATDRGDHRKDTQDV